MKKIFISLNLILSIFLFSKVPVFAIGETTLSNEAGVLNRQYQQQLKDMYVEKNYIETTEEDIKKENEAKEKEKQFEQLFDGKRLSYNPKFVLTKLKFVGNTVISDRCLNKLTKEYIGKEIYLDDLIDLTTEVSRYYQKRGYITSFAFIDKQEIIDGVVTISIKESRVALKESTGNKWERNRFLNNFALGGWGLNEGNVFNAKALQGAMKNINSSNYMQGSVELSRNDDYNTEIKMNVEDRFPLSWDMSWDDYGRNYTGRQRWTTVVGMDNLTGFGDKIYGGTILSKDSRSALAGYEVPIGRWGTKLGFDFSHSNLDLGGPYRQYGISGKATDYILRLTQPLHNTATQEINFNVAIDWLNSRSDSKEFGNLSDYSLRVIRTSLNGVFDDKYGRTITNIGLDIGIDGMGASQGIPGVAESAFYKIIASLARVQRLPRECLAIFRINGQYSGQPLFPTEQMYLGGAYSLRGYQPSELLGDYGVAGSLEFRTHVPGIKSIFPKKFEDDWARKVKLVLFYDWGYLNSQNNNYDAATNFLHSFGGGLNINFTDAIALQFGVGIPLLRKLNENSGRFYFAINTELDKMLLKPKSRTKL